MAIGNVSNKSNFINYVKVLIIYDKCIFFVWHSSCSRSPKTYINKRTAQLAHKTSKQQKNLEQERKADIAAARRKLFAFECVFFNVSVCSCAFVLNQEKEKKRENAKFLEKTCELRIHHIIYRKKSASKHDFCAKRNSRVCHWQIVQSY